MKRPDGFDPKPSEPPPGRKRQTSSPKAEPAASTQAKQPQQRAKAPDATKSRPVAPPPIAEPARAARSIRGASRRSPRPDAATRAELRRSARARRKFERAEVRRFTRRARNRKIGIATGVGVLAALIGLVFIAVYSPILALRSITVDGTSRINAADVQTAVSGQLGTPLALLDYDTITRDLTVFPLIRSYVTEIVPPDTLLIHITEREPVGSVKVGEMYNLVDPAGIVLEQSSERIVGVPVLELPDGDLTGAAFASIVAVLLALPPDMLAQVDSVTARTQDDVALVLTGVGQGVTWGSADDSDTKASLLSALIKLTDPNQPGVFDVSAPSNGVFRPS